MSYDLHFVVRPGGSAPSLQSLRAYFAARPHWTVDEDGAAYRNALTGVQVDARFRARDDGPSDRVPLVVSMSDGLRPPCSIYEVADEIEAFVQTFELLVDDPQANGERPGEFARDALYAGFDSFNRHWHRVNLRSLGHAPPPSLPRERVEQTGEIVPPPNAGVAPARARGAGVALEPRARRPGRTLGRRVVRPGDPVRARRRRRPHVRRMG